jgi:nucleoside-diphosphate-sugar epimerase
LEAITKGLLSSSSKPAFLIHLSGTGIVADWHDPTYLGKLNPKVWSDISNIDEITSRPDGELHRQTEKYLQSVVAKHHDKLKIAIICPPDIYGPGRGPGRQQSVYFPVFVKEMERVGPPFYVGEGTNTRSWVHIEDLMTVYLKLVEAAAAGGGIADWGKEVQHTYCWCMQRDCWLFQGYYFTASQEASQIDIATAVGKILKRHGRVEDANPIQLPLEQVSSMVAHYSLKDLGAYMFAANSRTKADRAEKLLGYKPEHPNLWDAMEADLLACFQWAVLQACSDMVIHSLL